MGAEITIHAAGLPVLPEALGAAIKTKTAWRGDDVAELPWVIPSTITPDLVSDAKAALPALADALRPAPREQITKWLASLGVLCAGQSSVAEAQAKVSAYAAMLAEYPPACFGRKSLEDAARRFKWLPAFAELSAFLDEHIRPLRQARARIEAIAAADPSQKKIPAKPRRRWADLTPEEQAKLDEEISTLRQHAPQSAQVDRTGQKSPTDRHLLQKTLNGAHGSNYSHGGGPDADQLTAASLSSPSERQAYWLARMEGVPPEDAKKRALSSRSPTALSA